MAAWPCPGQLPQRVLIVGPASSASHEAIQRRVGREEALDFSVVPSGDRDNLVAVDNLVDQRISGSFHGSCQVEHKGTRAGSGTQAIGISANQVMTLGFAACSACNAPSVTSIRLSGLAVGHKGGARLRDRSPRPDDGLVWQLLKALVRPTSCRHVST